MRLGCVAVAIPAALSCAVMAQTDPFVELAAENAHRFELRDGELHGPGREFLVEKLQDVQFVAFGEEHNRRAIHAFGSSLFRLLNERFGFEYLAIEEGEYWGQMLSTAAREGGADAVLALARRYPNAFHLLTEEEIRMIGEVGALSTAKSDAIWGLNQAFGAAHVYARLVEIATSAEARAAATELHERALQYEGERFRKNAHYLVEIATTADHVMLRAAFDPAPGSEAARLIDQIELSRSIYAPYGMEPAPAPAVFYESGRRREQNMKHLFADRYRDAVASGDAEPKVLAMFGHLHVYRGRSDRTELFTFGNFLSEFAAAQRKKSLHVYAAVDTPYTQQSFVAPLVRIAKDAAGTQATGTLIDLQPLFQHARSDTRLEPRLRRLVMSFDVFLFLADGAQGSVEALRTPGFRWYPQ